MEPIRAKEINADDRDKVLKILARVFIEKGGGEPVWRQAIKAQLKRDIVSSSLNNFMTSLVKHAYSQLQDFVSRQTGKKIRPLVYLQIQKIRIPMVRCRDWMSSSLLATFYKFISISILGSKQEVSKEEATELYEQLRFYYLNSKQKQQLIKQCRNKSKVYLLEKDKEQTINQHHIPAVRTTSSLLSLRRHCSQK